MSISVLLYLTTVWWSAQAIIVSVDRVDYKPTQKHSSMYGNGWRPVTSHDEINLNGSPSSKIQRFVAPLHPVIGKLQEHLGTSDTLKLQNRNRPPDFAPPTILGRFSVFGHATTKAREDSTLNLKLLPSETRKYSFLLPPNRDLFHSQDTKFVSKTQKPDTTRDSASFYSNGPRYSSTASPLVPNRPYLYTYNVQQTLQPPDRPSAAFEYQNQNKQYLVPPSVDYAKNFGKNISSQHYYNQNSHHQNFQPSNPNANNFFNYIGHPNPYKVTYERNPAYLIHESHEIGYVTPSYEMKFKPSYQNYVMPPGVYTSTLPPMQINYLQQRPNKVNENHSEIMPQKLKTGQANNEDFHKVRPEKYKQAIVNNTWNSYDPQQEADFVYIPPETQQYFRQTITPAEQTIKKEYETPESISLKHYNDQLARLAIQKNRERFRNRELTGQQELQRQQYEDYKSQQEEHKFLEKQQRLKAEKERTRDSGNKKESAREEYKVEYSREPQQVTSGHRYPLDQGKTIELYEVTVSEQPTVSRHPTTTHQPVTYYQSTQSPQLTYESPQDFWAQNVQYPPESFSSTKIPEQPLQSQKQSSKGELQIVSLYPEPVNTEVLIQRAKITESVKEVPVYTTVLPEKTLPERKIVLPTERTRNHRPGKRRRRPTVVAQEPHNISPKTKQQSHEQENLEGDYTRRNQTKKQQSNYEASVVGRKPSGRRRPEVGAKLNKNELDIQTEAVKPNRLEKPKDEAVYVTEYPTAYYQRTPTESTEAVTENVNFEYVTEALRTSRINDYEYVTEPTRPSRVNNYEYVTEPARSSRVTNYEYVTESTRPSRINNYEELQKTDYIETTTPTTSTTPFTTTKEPQISTTVTVSTTKATHRIRPSRLGNTSRPRFSVKEYKSRLDYKNRISQISTTDAGPESTHVKQRPTVDFKKKQQSEAARDTTGRYKYMSRVSYKTSSTTPATEDQANTTFTTFTRNKINRFSPKQRPNNSYLYRSRTTSTTSNSIKQDNEGSPTIRPENVYSSSIRHRPSVMRSKLKTVKEPSEIKDEIEMSTEETSFYSQPTSQPESVENQVNEIFEENVTPPNNEGNKDQGVSKNQESFSVNEKVEHASLKNESEFDLKIKSETVNDSSTPSSKQLDEELLEKASQSVADLTSSASALYNKPGLFKAVSPSKESRFISTHFKITTGEPTLPIEAFFQNLSEKV